MNVEEAREYCISKPLAEESFPFDDTTLVVKVCNKMFALIPLDAPDYIALKCEPEWAVELRERYDSIRGAAHFNKKYWNSVLLDSDVPDALIRQMIDHSYDEVIKKLPRRDREALLGL